MKFSLSEPTFGSINFNNPVNSNGFSNQLSSQRWKGSFGSPSKYSDNYNAGFNIQPFASSNQNFGAANSKIGRYDNQAYVGGNILAGSSYSSFPNNSNGNIGTNERSVQVTANSYPSITSNAFGGTSRSSLSSLSCANSNS